MTVRMTDAVAELTRRARRLAVALPLRRTALVVAAIIVTLGVLGAFVHAGAWFTLFDLDGEGKPPAAFSALLLSSTAVLCWLAGQDDAAHRRRWVALGGFFLFMAFDEALTVHETLSVLTGVGWLVLYLPIAALGGVAWLLVLSRLRSTPRLAAVWVLGACAWFTAQVLEAVQSGPGGRVDAYAVYATIEEVLELTGTALWLFVVLALVQASAAAARVPGLPAQVERTDQVGPVVAHVADRGADRPGVEDTRDAGHQQV